MNGSPYWRFTHKSVEGVEAVDVEQLLGQSIATLNAGRKAEARNLLMQVVEQDERNEMAWLWLSGAVDTDENRRICLENVLAINPNNGVASRGLESLIAKEGVRPLSAGSPPASEARSLKDKPATQPVVDTKDINPEPSPGSHTPVPHAKAKREKTTSDWKWLLLGSGGTAFLLLVGCLLAYVLGFIELPSAIVPTGPTGLVVPPATSAAALAPTPQPTPTRSLLLGNPRSYLPSQVEMPQGYTLNPDMSAPYSDEGSSIAYINLENALSHGDAVQVLFSACVLPSENQAESSFREIVSNEEETLQGFARSVGAQFGPANVEVPNVDESAALAGRGHNETLGPTATALYVIRVKNVIAIVWSVGNGQDHDSPHGLLQETLYYVSVVTDKLNE
jgi:hypothetical protein